MDDNSVIIVMRLIGATEAIIMLGIGTIGRRWSPVLPPGAKIVAADSPPSNGDRPADGEDPAPSVGPSHMAPAAGGL